MEVVVSNCFSLLDLPQELVFEILFFLDAPNLISTARVCRILNYLVSCCWKPLCINSFKLNEGLMRTKKNEAIDWKKYYFWKHALVQDNIGLEMFNPDNSPSPRMAHTSVPYNNNSIVFINGQFTQTNRFSDIFVYDIHSNSFTKPNIKGNVPSFARHSSAIVGDKVYTFGGFDGVSNFYELNVLDLQTMEWYTPKIKGNPPIARTNHTSTVIGDKMYIYGGNYTPPDGDYTVLGDLHILDTKTLTWEEPKCGGVWPGKRTAHTMKSIGTKIYLFGGGLWEPKPLNRWIAKYNDIYVLDTVNLNWSILPAQLNICSFPISWAMEHFIFFYGGQSATTEQLTNGLYYFDSISHEVTEIKLEQKPKPLDLGTASVIGNKAFIFGGSSGVPVNDMMCFNFKKPNFACTSEPESQMDVSC